MKDLIYIFARKFLSLFKDKKIVAIFRTDELGDFILWLDAAKKLRENFSGEKYKIILFCKPANRELASKLPLWDKIIDFEIDKYGTSFSYKILANLMLVNADIIINPIIGRPFAVDGLIGRSRAPQKYGLRIKWDQIQRVPEEVRQYGDRSYTELIEIPVYNHILEINLEFVNKICRTCFPFAPYHEITELERLAEVDSLSNYCIIVPGAGFPGRCWESSKFSELINKIHRYNSSIITVICGTNSERIISSRIKERVSDKSRLIDKCGESGSFELIKLVKHSKFIVGNDTATIHLGPCLKVPSVSILGGGHFGTFHPYPQEFVKDVYTESVYHRMSCYSCTWSCYQATTFDQPCPCISAITVDDVFEKVKKLMDK